MFWKNVGASIARPEDVTLTAQGMVVKKAIQNISVCYPAISVDQYVIMPNHIHLLLQIHTDCDGNAMQAPAISVVVQQMKGFVTKQLGSSIWQKLFHDHVIRSEESYSKIWNYIVGNPMKWTEDCFYLPEDS